MKEKKFIIVTMIVGLFMLGMGYLMGKSETREIPKSTFAKDIVPVVNTAKSIHIAFIDSVDGRPTYYVQFPDSTGLDSMYPEEIANGLITGKWSYNQDFQIIERVE